MTARYDAEVALLRDQPSPLLVRIGHDADELRRLADWLAILREERPEARDAVALDYFRLSARLLELSSDTHDFALSLTRVIP
jgi:hypothetical protein